MNEQTATLLEKLGATLSATGAKGWDILVQKAYVDGVIGMTLAGFSAVLVVVCGILLYKNCDKDNAGEIIGIVGLIVFSCVMIFSFFVSLDNVLCPQGAALEGVLGALRPR